MAEIVERLRAQARQSSDIARRWAEDKSLRQAGNTGRRTDLYLWPEPEHTLEGQAATAIEQQDQIIAGLMDAIEQAERALTPFANCVYNDNGDHTISDTYKLKAANYSDTYFARKKARAARDEARRALSEAASKARAVMEGK